MWIVHAIQDVWHVQFLKGGHGSKVKKIFFLLLFFLLVLVSVGFGYSWAVNSVDGEVFIRTQAFADNNEDPDYAEDMEKKGIAEDKHPPHIQNDPYAVKVSGQEIARFNDKEMAIERAKDLKRSVVIDLNTNRWIYSNLRDFMIITDTAIHDFETLDSAIRYARKNNHEKIYYKDDSYVIWENENHLPDSIKLNVPILQQYPELARGCEVTSLAMIFAFNGKNVNKMKLAQEIKKDPTPYSKDKNGRIYYGNPYDGFVGDIYNARKNGYGVYHGPIAELARNYFDEDVFDLTGLEFEDVLYFLSQGYPVWVIINSTYTPLNEDAFQMWHTPTGIVKVTSKEHSVVIAGYDHQTIYINDPLYPQQNKPVDRNNFKKAWEQMGHQAVVIIHK